MHRTAEQVGLEPFYPKKEKITIIVFLTYATLFLYNKIFITFLNFAKISIMGEIQKEPSPYQVAANHVARSRGSQREPIGSSAQELGRKRQRYIKHVSKMSAVERSRERKRLHASFKKLEGSGLEGTSEIQWAILVK